MIFILISRQLIYLLKNIRIFFDIETQLGYSEVIKEFCRVIIGIMINIEMEGSTVTG